MKKKEVEPSKEFRKISFANLNFETYKIFEANLLVGNLRNGFNMVYLVFSKPTSLNEIYVAIDIRNNKNNKIERLITLSLFDLKNFQEKLSNSAFKLQTEKFFIGGLDERKCLWQIVDSLPDNYLAQIVPVNQKNGVE